VEKVILVYLLKNLNKIMNLLDYLLFLNKKKGIIFSNTFTFDFNKNNKNIVNIIIGNYPHEYNLKNIMLIILEFLVV